MFFRMVYKSGQIFLPFCHNPRVWQTDGRTDRQTEVSSQYRGCITCSAVKRVNTWIYISLALYYKLFISKALKYGPCVTIGSHKVLPATHTCTNHTCLYCLAARRHRLLVGTHCAYPQGMARLSWPGWLVIYRDKRPAPGIESGHTHPSQY